MTATVMQSRFEPQGVAIAFIERLRGDARLVALAMLGWAFAAMGPASLPAEDFDLRASRVYIKVGKVGFGHEHAVVGKLKAGDLRIGAKEDAGELVFDMTSFDADTPEARKYVGLAGATDAKTAKEVNANMLGPDVLDVKQHPTALFAIRSAVLLAKKSRAGRPLVRLTGEFTLHGVKRPLDLDVEMLDGDGTKGLRGAFTMKQTSYGIKPFSKAFGAIGVTDELTIYGELVFAETQSSSRRPPERR